MLLDPLPEHFSFSDKEVEILELWKKLDAFKTQNELARDRPNYVFLDGPPFATGLPHYGHILISAVKDIVLRMALSRGFKVDRRFGWDCHGLPIEYEIDKTMGISSKEDVMAMGIDKYNEHCRGIVLRYTKEWESTITRLARWVDFSNDYKTMDPEFMESVWWVFKSLYEKDLVYRGFRVMPFSTACSTPLSNFEVQQNYKDVLDPSIHILFQLETDPNTFFLVWTTTPWCLPSNLALTVHPELTYVKVLDKASSRNMILLKNRLSDLYKKENKQETNADLPLYEILSECTGADLKGMRYVPLFDYYATERTMMPQDVKNWYTVVCDDYVSSDTGTGIVSNSPAFGEDDYRISMHCEIVLKGGFLACHVDDTGKFLVFNENFKDWQGVYIKDADKLILKDLKARGLLYKNSTFMHSYPFCWRSDTPLIYKAVPSWFIKVESIRDKLVANNKKTHWVPDFVSEKRFGNWLENARDWSVSRNRYWGTPIPMWVSDDYEEMVCVGSVEELARLSGVDGIKDLHRESIDHIEIASQCGKGKLKRIPEVFDCWFESGSMPYAQVHYPFDNKEQFEKHFPADFICEGLDQTRGWFYTLFVISTALFETPPFKNLIVSGLVLAADGKKMSKRLKNYPPPEDILNEYGADALRLYLINSPVVKAETLKFKKEGVRDIIKDVFLPWYNSYRFLVQNIHKYEKETGKPFLFDLAAEPEKTNQLDHWILASMQTLTRDINTEMDGYRLYTILPKLLTFIDNLTNIYVRLNRTRLRGDSGLDDQEQSLATLFEVLYTLTKLMSSFTPYLSESIYQNLRKALKAPESSTPNTDSIHYLLQSPIKEHYINKDIERKVGFMKKVVDLARVIRERKNIATKYPLKELVVLHSEAACLNDLESLLGYIESEINVKQITLSSDEERYGLSTRVELDYKELGARLGKQSNAVKAALAALGKAEIRAFQAAKRAEVAGFVLELKDVRFVQSFDAKSELAKRYASNSDASVVVLLDTTPDESMRLEGLAREIVNRTQRLRKSCKLVATDMIHTLYHTVKSTEQANLDKVLAEHGPYIEALLSNQPFRSRLPSDLALEMLQEEAFKISDASITIALYREKL